MATITASSSRPGLKVLMLHGYTQSGSLFRAKSAALAKFIKKTFQPSHGEVSICYPTAPHRLRLPDLPGYESPKGEEEDAPPDEEEIEAFAWFRRRDGSDPPEYLGLEDGLGALAKVLAEEGPFDGVIGFSQGAAMAAMMASLLEPNRADAFAHVVDASDGYEIGETPVGGIPFPSSFEPSNLLSHPPLKFAICYSGFRAPGPRYRAFYEHPPIRTPVLHILGSLDTVVAESRSRALIDACEGSSEQDSRVVWHPGGHFVPSQLRFLEAPVLFIRECLEGVPRKSKDEEEKVEDMEVPF